MASRPSATSLEDGVDGVVQVLGGGLVDRGEHHSSNLTQFYSCSLPQRLPACPVAAFRRQQASRRRRRYRRGPAPPHLPRLEDAKLLASRRQRMLSLVVKISTPIRQHPSVLHPQTSPSHYVACPWDEALLAGNRRRLGGNVLAARSSSHRSVAGMTRTEGCGRWNTGIGLRTPLRRFLTDGRREILRRPELGGFDPTVYHTFDRTPS